MDKNAAIVFYGPGKVVIENMEIPVPRKDQLLIRTSMTHISTGTELTILGRNNVPDGSVWDTYGSFPFYPGYSNIGIVVDAGEEVEREWIGKKVATYGEHAQYVVVAKEEARMVHEKISDNQAVFFTIAEIVMNSIRRGNVGWGDSVVVYGLGLLGQLAVRFCRLCGARPVFASDISGYRLNKLPEDSGIIPLNPKNDDVAEAVKIGTRNRMADIVFEVTGVADLIPKEFEVLRKQGRFVVLSSPRGKTNFDFHDLCNRNSYTIIGAHNDSHPVYESLDNPWTKKRDGEFFFDLLADGEVQVDGLISHKVHFSEAVGIYQMLLEDRANVMGVLLDWA